MMMKEFTDRTKYEPSFKEYAEIEESYYEFDGNKDEFCKYFMKELKAGWWEKEYQLRLKIRALEETLNQKEMELKAEHDLMCEYAEKCIDQMYKIDELEAKIPTQPQILYTALA